MIKLDHRIVVWSSSSHFLIEITSGNQIEYEVILPCIAIRVMVESYFYHPISSVGGDLTIRSFIQTQSFLITTLMIADAYACSAYCTILKTQSLPESVNRSRIIAELIQTTTQERSRMSKDCGHNSDLSGGYHKPRNLRMWGVYFVGGILAIPSPAK